VEDHADAVTVDFPEEPDAAQYCVTVIGDIHPPHLLDAGLALTWLMQSDLDALGPSRTSRGNKQEAEQEMTWQPDHGQF